MPTITHVIATFFESQLWGNTQGFDVTVDELEFKIEVAFWDNTPDRDEKETDEEREEFLRMWNPIQWSFSEKLTPGEESLVKEAVAGTNTYRKLAQKVSR